MMLRMLLLVPLFVLSFSDGIERPEDVQYAYSLVLRLLICSILLAAGNVLKTLLAKLLASHVHRQAFFDKMQDALQKVKLIEAQLIGPAGTRPSCVTKGGTWFSQ